MGRIAGDAPNYAFRLVRRTKLEDSPELSAADILTGGKWHTTVTPFGFELPSVTTIIGEVLGKPLAYWGFRIGLQGVVDLVQKDWELVRAADDAEILELLLKDEGVSPNASLESAGSRGNNAHDILELLAAGDHQEANRRADEEAGGVGTQYGVSVIAWWGAQIQPYIDSGEILEVRSEQPVWSLEDRWCGTFDLAIHWARLDDEGQVFDSFWEIVDLKTHKPAAGFTTPGKGPGYLSDALQVSAYADAFGKTVAERVIGARVVIARDKKYRGKNWVEDDRQVPYEAFRHIRALYDVKRAFEKGE